MAVVSGKEIDECLKGEKEVNKVSGEAAKVLG